MGNNSGKRVRQEKVFVEFNSIKPLNYIQETYLHAIHTNDIVFGIGCAGTGKTYVAAGYAAEQLFRRNINKVILTRPNIEASKSLGYLPGTIEDKYNPYLEPFESAFIHTLGKGFYEYAVKEKQIEPKPLGFMRGVTFENCIVLVDEVQNMTKSQFLMLLSRIGKNAKIILSGDNNQYDIKDSGLDDAVSRLENLSGVEIVRFLDNDIVRSKMCKQIIMAYRDS